MAAKGVKWLRIPGSGWKCAGNGFKLMEVVENGWTWLGMYEIAKNNRIYLDMLEIANIWWKWTDMNGHFKKCLNIA